MTTLKILILNFRLSRRRSKKGAQNSLFYLFIDARRKNKSALHTATMLDEDDGEHPADAVAAAEAAAAGGRGASWVFPEDVCALLAIEGVNSRQMESVEELRIEAARHSYKELTQRFVELVGWPVVPRAGSRQPASREASIAERRVDFSGKRIFHRVKVQLKPAMRIVLAGFEKRYAKYDYKPRSGLNDADFYEEVEAELLDTLEGAPQQAVTVFRYVCPDSPLMVKSGMEWFASNALKEYKINPRERAVKTPGRTRKVQRRAKRAAAAAGLDPLTYQPNPTSSNSVLTSHHGAMTDVTAALFQILDRFGSAIDCDISDIVARVPGASTATQAMSAGDQTVNGNTQERSIQTEEEEVCDSPCDSPARDSTGATGNDVTPVGESEACIPASQEPAPMRRSVRARVPTTKE